MRFALRPMSTAEILDRTFSLYRNNFLLFAGIAILPAALALILHLIGVATHITVRVPGRTALQAQLMFLGYEFMVIFVASVIGGGIATGATAFGVYHVNLEQRATIAGSYRKVMGSGLRVIAAAILVFLLMVVIVVVVFFAYVYIVFMPLERSFTSGTATLFFVVGLATFLVFCLLWLYLSAFFAFVIPALLLDNTTFWGAFRRSRFLAKGSTGRIFLVLLLTLLLTFAFTSILRAPGLMLLSARRQAVWLQLWTNVAQFFSALLAGPIATIAVALIYIDQKVRKEAFDLQVMLDAIQESVPQPPPAPPAGEQPIVGA